MIRVIYKEQIQKLREENNTTQITIASILKIGKSCYSQYENEERIIPLKYINEISNFYNVSIDYIFGFNKNKKYSNSIKEIDQILSGKRLKEFRKKNNLTLIKLAQELNTVHPTIVNYENGKHLIATPFLYTICKKYNISADYLLGKIDEPQYLNKNYQ